MSVLPLLKFDIRQVPSHPSILISDQAIAYKRHPKQHNLLMMRKPTPDAKNYLVLGYRGAFNRLITCFIHRLVAEVFLPPPKPAEEVRHLNGESTNNLPANLAWGTRKQNMEDARRHGTMVMGDRQHCASITNDEAGEIKWLIALGATDKAIAKAYGINRQVPYRIRVGRSWRSA